MDDAELDQKLRRGIAPRDARVVAAVEELVLTSRDAASRVSQGAPSPHRRKVLLGGVVAAAVALTAGASITAAQLGLPPFQGVPPGFTRLATAIPVDYTEQNGNQVSCEAFLEFQNLEPSVQTVLEADVRDHDWSAVGQDAYDASRGAGADGDESATEFIDRLRAVFFAETKKFLPELVDTPSDSSVALSGYGMSCTPQNG